MRVENVRPASGVAAAAGRPAPAVGTAARVTRRLPPCGVRAFSLFTCCRTASAWAGCGGRRREAGRSDRMPRAGVVSCRSGRCVRPGVAGALTVSRPGGCRFRQPSSHFRPSPNLPVSVRLEALCRNLLLNKKFAAHRSTERRRERKRPRRELPRNEIGIVIPRSWWMARWSAGRDSTTRFRSHPRTPRTVDRSTRMTFIQGAPSTPHLPLRAGDTATGHVVAHAG